MTNIPKDAMSTLTKNLDEFDRNLKMIDFYLETESFYDLNLTMYNINKANNLLSTQSGILANIHGVKYEFSREYQLKIYEKIKNRFDDFERRRFKLAGMKRMCEDLINQEKLNKLSLQDKGTSQGFIVAGPKDVVDVNLVSNYHESLLGGIRNNLRETSQNTIDTAISLKNQANNLKESTMKAESAGQNSDQARSTLSSLSWGQKCQRIWMHMVAILLFIVIVIILAIKIIKSA